MTRTLSADEQARLGKFARALIDQQSARVVVPPQQPASGFWFGGGNMIEDRQGNLLLVGRYRNVGDSRTGLGAGQRGLELAIFRSSDRGETFEKIVSFSKADLNVDDKEVLSIEGSALAVTRSGVELFVSTEKTGLGYPAGWEDYLKPGAGVWTIDQLAAESVEQLSQGAVRTVVRSIDPQFLHVKDPFVYPHDDGRLTLFFCTHPYSWTSSNTARAVRRPGESDFEAPDCTFFPRGSTWDVAMTRGTCVLDVPRVGPFRNKPVSLMFYDGGESLRNLDEHQSAVRRPRGYSCEEIGGVAYVVDGRWDEIQRLSLYEPWFVSPHGTGCSRYVDVLAADDKFFATWQQSQDDLSQPLVMNVLDRQAVEQMLA